MINTAPSKIYEDVAMSAVGKTLIFPREDNLYMKKESIGYDEAYTKIWQENENTSYRSTHGMGSGAQRY